MSVQQHNVQGVLIYDIHSISQQDSIQKIFCEEHIKQVVINSFWGAQNKFLNVQVQENKNVAKSFEDSQVCSENIRSLDISNIVVPSLEQNQNQHLVTFDIDIVWKELIKSKYFFVKCKNPKFRNFVSDQQQKYGQVTVISNFWLYNNMKEEVLTDLQPYKPLYDTENKQFDVEIPEEYYLNSYQKIMEIGGGSFGIVNLYFDRKSTKLVAVKQLINIFKDPINVQSNKEEYKRVMSAVKQHPNKANDTQIQGLNRNIVREIKVLSQLNMQEDKRGERVNKLEGVIFPEVTSEASNKPYKTILLVFEFFGGCEQHNQNLTSDIYRYLSDQNNRSMLNQMFPTLKEKRFFIKSLFNQILDTVGYLHQQKILIRDLKDDNILMRRIYDPENLNCSQFQIQMIDFGLSKKINNQAEDSGSLGSEEYEPLEFSSKQQSIVYQADTVPSRHPIYRYAAPYSISYDFQDDVYALGILLLRLHNYFNLLNEIDSQSQKLIATLTGLNYDTAKYYLIDMISKRADDAKEGLQDDLDFNEKNLTGLQTSRESIPLLQQIPEETINLWMKRTDNKSQIETGSSQFDGSQDDLSICCKEEEISSTAIVVVGSLGVLLIGGLGYAAFKMAKFFKNT